MLGTQLAAGGMVGGGLKGLRENDYYTFIWSLVIS